MIVNITKKHIKNGHRNSIYECPLALAIKCELGKGGLDVSVGYQTVEIDNKLFVLSKPAAKFVEDFDAGKEVRPQKLKAY